MDEWEFARVWIGKWVFCCWLRLLLLGYAVGGVGRRAAEALRGKVVPGWRLSGVAAARRL